MKILILGTTGESIPPPYAGIPKHTLLLARNWKQSGHKVGVSFVYEHSPSDDLDAQADYFFEYKSKPDKVSKILFLIKFFFKNPILYFKLLLSYSGYDRIDRESILYSAYGVYVDEIVKKFKPDVCMIEAALIKGYMAANVCKMRNIPVAVHVYAEVHDLSMTPNKRLKSSSDRLKKYWVHYFDNVDLVLSPSEYCALGPKQYIDKNKIKTVYFGIDVSIYENFKEAKDVSRIALNLPDKPFIAVAVGAFTPRKGHDHLIKAAGILREKGFDINVALCGPGDKAWLQEVARQAGMKDRVHFFTGLSEMDLMRLYRASDLYCDASNTVRACLGMSLTEGMIIGLPAVAYRAGGMPEVVFDDVNGFLADTDNVAMLAEKIEKVLRLDSTQYKTMSEKAVEVAKKYVDIDIESERVLSILSNIVSK